MPDRCASGSWPGQSQCLNDAADDPEFGDGVFCWDCWAAVWNLGPECGCSGCASYFKAIS